MIEAYSNIPTVIKHRPYEWVGMLAFHGDELRELDYPGYQRQRYNDGEYFRFEFKQCPPAVEVAAMGLFHTYADRTETPHYIHLHASWGVFAVRPGDAVQVAVATVFG